MRSPKEMQVIQIDITNACMHECGNCTRFCGHHKKPFFMDFDTFKSSVDSLNGYKGIVGIIGGEPTLHPEFEKFILYLKEKRPAKYSFDYSYKPIVEYVEYIMEKSRLNAYFNNGNSPGLWSCLQKNYYKHYELIHDIFPVQLLNDHMDTSYHAPLLLARKDYGVSDEEFYKLRDACWIQNRWSASVTPKGAFFCEVAAALDMLFDGPGGWEIEPNWWKRKPNEFGEQLAWCELCGAALKTVSRDANEGIDDVSPTLLEKLKRLESKKVKQNRVLLYGNGVNIFDDKNNAIVKENKYIDDYHKRFSEKNKTLYIDTLNAIVPCDKHNIGLFEKNVKEYASLFNKIYILNSGDIKPLGGTQGPHENKNISIITHGKNMNACIGQALFKCINASNSTNSNF